MAMNVEIKCINKDDRYDPYDSIKNVGGTNSDETRWSLSLANAISGVESGKYSFFVKQGGRIVDVVVAKSAYGNKYLKTEDDDYKTNNLLSLPECP